MKRDARRITDPVHGTIQLSEVEAAVVDSPPFQRLRHVAHLGLAHLVYPGADFSRFSHSLGACHVMGQMVASLRGKGVEIDDSKEQTLRLAALTHDIGHYPYSHATEHAVTKYYSNRLVVARNRQTTDVTPTGELGSDASILRSHTGLEHEPLGKEVLTRDPSLRSIFETYGVSAEALSSAILGEASDAYNVLMSSDLDSDRIDYLLRTSHATGLPYGHVDIDYLIQNLVLDASGTVSVADRALRAAEHFLMARVFDYQQVATHKTVAAMESILQDVILELLVDGPFDLSAANVIRSIEDGSWRWLTDESVSERIREYASSNQMSVGGAKATALILRMPPKLVWSREWFESLNAPTSARSHKLLKVAVMQVIEHATRQFGLPEGAIFLWERDRFTITKVFSFYRSVARDGEDKAKKEKEDEEKIAKMIHILSEGKARSAPISDVEGSLMSVMSNYAPHSIRVYVVPGFVDESLLNELQRFCTEEIP